MIKKANLSEKLTSLIHTRPSAIDSDDDDLATADKIAPNENDSEFSADELDISRFRRINNVILEEDDQKYSGEGISRRDLDNSSDSTKNEVDNSSDAHSSRVEESESDELEEDVEEATSKAKPYSFKCPRDSKKKSTESKEEYNNFNQEIFLKAASDIEKGRAIKNQLHIWDFLLECRMRFQKCLVFSNQLPTYKNFHNFKNRGNPLFQESVVKCKKSLKHLLNSLLLLQNVFLKSNEDFLNSFNYEKKQAKDFNDEEILSELDEDNDKNNISTLSKKFKKLNDFSTEISKRYADFQSYQNKTIQKWNDKTRIGFINKKNFSAFELTILKQIENVLLDKQRLIKRSQTKRSNYHILGEKDQEPPKKKFSGHLGEDSAITSSDNKNRSLHKEIFDDDDFYHQLLNEMVKRKASDLTDPVQLGRQWMQLQKIRNKMKKAVDSKASKGRKIRFVVHPKLVNFMMPIYDSNYDEESKTELFNSLFGKIKK